MKAGHPQAGQVRTIPRFGVVFDVEVEADTVEPRLRLRAEAQRHARRNGIENFTIKNLHVGKVFHRDGVAILPARWWESALSLRRYLDLTTPLQQAVGNGIEIPKDFDLPLATVTSRYRDGDEHGWDTEFGIIHREFPADLLGIRRSMEAEGQMNPVLLGSDGRVWDGHKRLAAATDLGWKTVKVTYPEWDDD